MISWIVTTPATGPMGEEVIAESYAVHDNGTLAFYSDGSYFAKPTFMVGPLVKMYGPGAWRTMRPRAPLPVTYPK